MKVTDRLRNIQNIVQRLIARFAWAKWVIFFGMMFFSATGMIIEIYSVMHFSKPCFIAGLLCLLVGARLNIAYTWMMSYDILTKLMGRWSKIISPIAYYLLGTVSFFFAKGTLPELYPNTNAFPFGSIGALVMGTAILFALFSSGLACSLLFYFVLVPEARRFEARMRLIGEFQVRDDP
ncbi:MAG: hypothetical protein M1324_00890 [Patescibacteria group bacterium]|nr:hypothetical protein [Patescibacteria group bacterium]